MNSRSWGRIRFNASKQGGVARLSTARTFAPLRDSHLAIESPVSPIPSTTAFFPESSYAECHLNFNVDNPNNTSIMVMIQNLTTT